METFNGIIHNGGVPNGPHIHLPLEELRVRAVVVDISARVTLTQVYLNPSEHSTSRAVYCFPVPANAAVCAFEMETEDHRIIKGVCKEKSKAKKEYEEAIRAGRHAGMLEWVTDDIFTVSVGAVPARERVTTKLVFVMNLMNDDNRDQIRLQLPMHIGERYGTPPTALENALSPSETTRVRITTDIQTSGAIERIESPSHGGEIAERRYPTHLGRESRRRTTVKYRSPKFLERDFVLIIQADKLDESRCFAELEPRPNNGESDASATLALQLTIVPKFKLPPIPSQEYLFVIDRSGSMQGARISTAKKTLNMLLRMLPTNDTYFNIYSFGSTCNSTWAHSVQYGQATLDYASSDVDGMDANYGGTEIRNALQMVLNGRRQTTPTAIFLLTDGESYDIDQTISLVRTNVNQAPLDAPLRVYTLGIGDGISEAMCQGIANAGNGACLFATTAESIVGKCARLLRAGRTPIIKNVTIDWGIPASHLTSNSSTVNFMSRRSQSRTVKLRSSPVVQQAPTVIQDIHAGMRFVVFAIVKLRKLDVPKEVNLRGRVDGLDSEHIIDIAVPIRGVQLTKSEPGLPLVHTLAAWYLIREHRLGSAPMPIAVVPTATDEEKRKAAIVRLGERYQIASEFTAFVATDNDRERDERHSRMSRNDFGNYREHLDNVSESNVSQGTRWSRASAALRDSVHSLVSPFLSGTQEPPVPGAWPESPVPSRSPSPDDEEDDYSTDTTFSTISTLEDYSSDWSEWSEPARPPPTEEDIRLRRSSSPAFRPESLASESVRESRRAARQPRSIPPPQTIPVPPVKHEVMDVMRLQRFDGSFELNDLLNTSFISPQVVQACHEDGVDEKVVATAIAVAFMMKNMSGQTELLNDLVGKAEEYLQEKNAGHIIRKAQRLL